MGLGADATLDDVKAKYKALVKQHHPDANGGDRSTEDRLIEIIKAYNYLKTVVRGAAMLIVLIRIFDRRQRSVSSQVRVSSQLSLRTRSTAGSMRRRRDGGGSPIVVSATISAPPTTGGIQQAWRARRDAEAAYSCRTVTASTPGSTWAGAHSRIAGMLTA